MYSATNNVFQRYSGGYAQADSLKCFKEFKIVTSLSRCTIDEATGDGTGMRLGHGELTTEANAPFVTETIYQDWC